MSTDTEAKPITCGICGRVIERGKLLGLDAWLADVPFGEGMLACPGRGGTMHRPADEGALGIQEGTT